MPFDDSFQIGSCVGRGVALASHLRLTHPTHPSNQAWRFDLTTGFYYVLFSKLLPVCHKAIMFIARCPERARNAAIEHQA